MSSSSFQLPPLYFQDRGASFSAQKNHDDESSVVELPSEVLHKCLTDYAIFGDLAKLATVQTAWSNCLYDAASTSTASQWNLACALLEGSDGLAPNTTQAIKLLRQLVEVEIDPLTQIPIYENDNNNHSQQGAKQMSEYATKAMKKMAFLYLNGNDTVVEKDNTIGLAWLECAFYAGKDVDAAHDIALIKEYGRFQVENDVVAAANWFEKAAVGGHIEAMAELGLCYELGCGVETSDEQALDWYMKAAEAGHTTAKFSVGEIFEEARGVPQSDEEACLWYYKAAIEGDEDSRKALRRLEDIARIVVPGVRALLDG